MKIVVDKRFEGPPAIANGGYVAGMVAEVMAAPLEVRLHAPVPVGRPLQLDHEDHTVTLSEGTTVLAWGRVAVEPAAAPEFVGFSEAMDAVESRGRIEHPFPRCFVCGPDRTADDGLRLLPAPVPGTTVMASPWVPHETLVGPGGLVSERFVWAALDCPTYWSIAEPGELALLGTLSGRVLRPVRPGERCVVVSQAAGREKRKLFCGSALYGEGGELIGAAQATWIKVG